MLRNLLLRLSKLLLWLIALSVLLVLLLRWVPPPFTALMIERKIESWHTGEAIDLTRKWRPWKELPDDLKMAVIAAEDQKSLRGASTLSQQVAKNLFLWSGRSWPRKGLEAWFTALIELLWPKQRILEVYLNSVEWADGIFGAEAAARHHFGIGAPYLSSRQASLLAAVLPNPRQWSAGKPSGHVNNRAAWIRQQMRQLGGSHYLQRIKPDRRDWWPSWL